jgi:uncharacterized protein
MGLARSRTPVAPCVAPAPAPDLDDAPDPFRPEDRMNTDHTLPDAEERQMAMFAHLSMLSLFITGFGLVVGPLVIWLMKKDESAFVDENGMEAVNFAISIVIWNVAAVAMAFTVILLPVAFVIWIGSGLFVLIMSIVAGLKANDGITFRYPLTFRLLR